MSLRHILCDVRGHVYSVTVETVLLVTSKHGRKLKLYCKEFINHHKSINVL